MENISIAFQLIVAISVLIVWIFRYDNIVVEFKHYGYSDLLRNFVGVAKTSTSTLLIKLGSSGEYVTKDAINKKENTTKNRPNTSITLFIKKSLILAI